MKKGNFANYYVIIAGAVLCWVVIIIASGAGWNPFGVRWSFQNSGAFGDSFGPLSAVMAAIAAISAVAALSSQQQEMSRLQEREAESDLRNEVLDFERTFFQLLEHHRSNVQSIDVDVSGHVRQGHDAFKSIIYTFERRTVSGHQRAWEETFSKYENDLSHYFRFLYHLVNFIDSKSRIDRYFYVRLVRAGLSQSETLAIAFNCMWGEGRDRFKILVEKYALLHNLSQIAVQTYRLDEKFNLRAFKHVEQPD